MHGGWIVDDNQVLYKIPPAQVASLYTDTTTHYTIQYSQLTDKVQYIVKSLFAQHFFHIKILDFPPHSGSQG